MTIKSEIFLLQTCCPLSLHIYLWIHWICENHIDNYKYVMKINNITSILSLIAIFILCPIAILLVHTKRALIIYSLYTCINIIPIINEILIIIEILNRS